MKNIFILISFVLLFSRAFTNVKTEIIYFKTNLSKIEKTEIRKLKKVSGANQILLIGHTDSNGDDDYNQKLSEQRVLKVYNYLISKGISKHKIEYEFYGEKKPLNSNSTFSEKQKNRRVEIKYLKDPLLSYEVEEQIFDVNNSGITNIEAKEGTIIYIQENTFQEKDVKIVLREYYNPLSILCSNLSTKSHGENIETAGMLYLEAFANGKKVLPQKPMAIFFENKTDKTDFKYFSGQRKSDLSIDWTVEKKVGNNYFSSNNFLEKFGVLNKEAIVSWLKTNDKTTAFNWFKYFYTKNMLELSKTNCFSSKVELTLDNLGNVVHAGFKDSVIITKKDVMEKNRNMVLKCNEKIENARRKKFEKGFKLDPNSYEISLKLVMLNKKNKKIMESINVSNNELEKEMLLASLDKNIEMEGPLKFLTQTLGWINCDRFINNKDNVDFVVEVPTGMNVRMIVKKYNSYFGSVSINDNKNIFNKIPKGEEVTLICTKYEKGEIIYAIAETTISTEIFSDFNFSTISKEGLKELISSL